MTDDISRKLGELSGRVADHDVTLAGLVTMSDKVDKVSDQVAKLQIQVGGEGKKKGYKPHSNPRWWDLVPSEYEAELGRVRGWYNDLAKRYLDTTGIPKCVLDHEMTVFMLDAACETWKTLWVSEERQASLAAAQCEFLTRIWPAMKDQLIKALNSCSHQSGLAPFQDVA